MAGADILAFPNTPSIPVMPPLDGAVAYDELQIALRLHRHLDIHQLLEQFLLEIQHLNVDGLAYTVPESGEAFLIGLESRTAVRSRLSYAGEFLGELELQVNGEFRAPLNQTMAPLASPLFNALCHYRLKQLARKDPLTGLGNRLALETALATETSRSQRFGHPLSLLVVDIDHFKGINDTFGHSIGDQVIRAVATEIKECLRPYDFAFRFGGEEFVVLLSQTVLNKGMHIAERIRQRISRRCRIEADRTRRVTVSIGGSEFRGAEDIHELFERADRALYMAKNEGRNRVIASA